MRKQDEKISVNGILPHINIKNKNGIVDVDIKVYQNLESTNNTAMELIKTDIKKSSLIVAQQQKKGRGRYGRSFFSPPDTGIYMSLIIPKNKLTFSEPTLVTAFAAVSVCMAIEKLTNKVPKIKWVNDILLGDKKICGILTEAAGDYIIIGIGINYNTPTSDFPIDIRHTAGSLFPRGTAKMTRNRLIAEITNRIIGKTNTDTFDVIDEYKQRSCVLGKLITVISQNETYPATAIDINESGHLIVKTNTGDVRSLSFGTIETGYKQPVVALTLDDGPNTTNSVRILDELESRGLVATFFVIGSNIDEQSAKVMKRAYAMGCEYANHSWDWISLGDKTPEEITISLTKTNNKIVEILGEKAKPKFFRAPNLSTGNKMIKTVKKLGFPLVDGIVGNDWEASATPQSIYDLVVPKVSDGSIILLHDGVGNDATAEGIGAILDALIKRGFKFVTLSELFKIKSVNATPGKSYNNV